MGCRGQTQRTPGPGRACLADPRLPSPPAGPWDLGVESIMGKKLPGIKSLICIYRLQAVNEVTATKETDTLQQGQRAPFKADKDHVL